VIGDWYEKHKDEFVPPICNKLMHKGQLSVMFVGGPNTREDFHIEEGSEFFFQMRGNMFLPTIQNGRKRVVEIKEGHVFLLPSRVPHSPQRPETGSLGLVIERERVQGESDALRYYSDFNLCKQVLWERHFRCTDLGKDLGPVVQSWKNSEEFTTRVPTAASVPSNPLVVSREDIELPDPFHLGDFVRAHEVELQQPDSKVVLFPDHVDKEFSISLCGPTTSLNRSSTPGLETFIYQVEGSCEIHLDNDQSITVTRDACFVIGAGMTYRCTRDTGSVSMVVTQNPKGNK